MHAPHPVLPFGIAPIAPALALALGICGCNRSPDRAVDAPAETRSPHLASPLTASCTVSAPAYTSATASS